MVEKNYVAVLNGEEHFYTLVTNRVSFEHEDESRKFVAQLGLECEPGEERTVRVEIFSLIIEKGKLVRRKVKSCDVRVPERRRTQQEFEQAMKIILKDIPENIAGWISQKAWDEGHSFGYQEVVTIAGDIADTLMLAIQKDKDKL